MENFKVKTLEFPGSQYLNSDSPFKKKGVFNFCLSSSFVHSFIHSYIIPNAHSI